MAALLAGVQYGLSSQGNFNENKELIFVKLTDSAFRAIQEYLRNRNKCTQTPTIQFLGNEGHLSLPSSQAARGQAAFKFSLSSNTDVQGSFECIQQTGARCLESVGVLPCKMRIHANEDVYDRTKHRMALVEEEHKKNCTREIDLDKAGLGRRVKVRSKPSSALPPRAPVSNGYHSSYPTAPAPAHTKPQGNNHAQKPGNPEIMRRTIRDRLIHLLAVRPYKKPELYLAINRDGLRDRDRNHLMSTLLTIAVVRDNTYHLMRHVWNDVQEDWPFYTEQDRQMLKRRKPQNLTPPGSSDGGSSAGSGQSPSSVHPGSPPSAVEPPSSLLKRPGYYNAPDGLPTKRQRISRIPRNNEEVYRRSESPAPIKVSPQSKPSRYRSSFAPTVEKPLPMQMQDRPSKPLLPRPESDKPPPRTNSPSIMPSVIDKKKEENNDTTVVQPNVNNNPIYTETPKFLSEYTTILSLEQRRRYKEDFNANYNEYRSLHSIVEEMSCKFAQLEERLRREIRGSEAWKKIKNQIVNDYEESKKNTRHQNAKRRFQYLHDKLSHIKRLVLDYDSNVNT